MGEEQGILSELEKLSATDVLEKVAARLSSEKGRSLWRKVYGEMKSGGVKSAFSWLESYLKQASERTREALTKFKGVEE
jgi:pyrroloquinoline quinone (PQQ) biosynthesis protein C